MVALGPVPRLSRAKLTFMFLSHKQLAGASAGNERPLSVATVARSGAMPNWPAGDFKRISSALPWRTCSCLIVLKLDAKHNIWNQRVDQSRRHGKTARVASPALRWNTSAKKSQEELQRCIFKARTRAPVHTHSRTRARTQTHCSFHRFLGKQWEERKVNKPKGIHSVWECKVEQTGVNCIQPRSKVSPMEQTSLTSAISWGDH